MDQYRRFKKVKIIGHNLLANVSIPKMRDMLPGSDGPLQHVRVLDLSFPSNALKNDTKLKVCIPAILSFLMTGLREIDLSRARVRESALRYFADACPGLEKVTWNHQHHGMGMEGTALNTCPCLKEIYMDDSTFFYVYTDELTAILIEGAILISLAAATHFLSACLSIMQNLNS